MLPFMSFVIGFLLGTGAAAFVAYRMLATARTRWQQETEAKQAATEEQINQTMSQLRDTFANLSREALSANSEEFLKLASVRMEQQSKQSEDRLENKKVLIDHHMTDVTKKLGLLTEQLHQFDKTQRESHGLLKGQVEQATRATNRLQDTTNRLQDALANPKRRGQWGERMAEDVLRLAGFKENINYQRQKQMSNRRIPDFTFPLPSGKRIHMDVKFPLDNYLKVMDATNEQERQTATQQFLRDVKSTIKDVTDREYVAPEDGTVDYVLVFIPNEQVYGFLHDADPTLMDDSLQKKVVLCAPMTLYAILAVVRQATENFYLEQASRQILKLLAEFKKQWANYLKTSDKMGKHLDNAVDQYREMIGTRQRALERQLEKIATLETSNKSADKKDVLGDTQHAASLDSEQGAGVSVATNNPNDG
ncbi:MAG: DNA recombination protein RmuC [Phycisphaerae bacterium]